MAEELKQVVSAKIRDIGGLIALEPEWQRLVSLCPAATVFQTYEWNAAWWRHFGSVFGRRLHIVTFRDPEGTLIGLAPLMTSFWYATPLRRVSFLGTGTSDYLDLLAAPGWEPAVVESLFRFLEQGHGWQIADFQQLRDGSVLREHCRSASALSVLERAGEACPYLPLPESWDALLAGLGKKTRANVGYYDRGLRKVYEVTVGTAAGDEELDTELTALFALHERRWNRRWLPGVFSGSRVQAFHRDAARRLLERNWLRLFYLRLDGTTQASLYCFGYQDRLCYYQGGFEPSLARLSLGTVLTARAMQSAISEGRQVFDFLRGDEPYKAKWTEKSLLNRRLLVTRPGTPFPWLARLAQRWEARIEQRGKAWMRGLKSKPVGRKESSFP